MNTYEAKQEARRERLGTAASRHQSDALSRFEAAHHAVEHIPMGQPILVGHHSEARHRRDLNRYDSQMRKAIEEEKLAKALAHKAAAVGSGGISSDDPEAVTKLEAELVRLEAAHAIMKDANKAKKGSFQQYSLTNSSANIRRVKARIEALKAKTIRPIPATIEGEGFRIVEDTEINRVCVEFDAIPSEAIRTELKSHGFKWSPNRGAWVRMASNQAWYLAQQAVK